MGRFAFFFLLIGCGSDKFMAGDAAPDGASTSDGAMGGDARPGVPISIVQATTTQTSGNMDPSMSFSMAPIAGNAVIVAMTCFSDIDNCTIPPGGVTDNQGNPYIRVVEGDSIISQPTHGSRGYIFITESIGAPNGTFTITANPNGTPPTNFQNFAWGAIEVAGLVTSGTVDRTGATPNTCCTTSTMVATMQPTTLANELAVAVHTARTYTPMDADFGYGHDASWTEHHVNGSTTGVASQHSMVAKILGSTGVVSHTWTHDAPTRGTSAIIATFKGRSQ